MKYNTKKKPFYVDQESISYYYIFFREFNDFTVYLFGDVITRQISADEQ